MGVVVRQGDKGVAAVHSAFAVAPKRPCLLPPNAAADAVATGNFYLAAIFDSRKEIAPPSRGTQTVTGLKQATSEADAAASGAATDVDGLGMADGLAERPCGRGFVD